MTVTISDADVEGLKSWYQGLLHTIVQEMIKTGVVIGIAIEARPVWAAPGEILVAQVWNASKKSEFIWTISGEKFATDHIAGSLATTPREAARHFALKWQVDADHLLNLIKNKAPDEKTEEQMQDQATELTQYAESLYELTNLEDIWEQELV